MNFSKIKFLNAAFFLGAFVWVVSSCNMEDNDAVPTIDDPQVQVMDEDVKLAFDKFFALVESGKAKTVTKEEMNEWSLKSNKKWVAMASGGGEDLYPSPFDYYRKITFHARNDAEGNTEGAMYYSYEDIAYFMADIECMVVEDNMAFIIFRIDGTNERLSVAFIDNGEGANYESDRHSLISGGVSEDLTCESFMESLMLSPDPFPVEWVKGNVQVSGPEEEEE